MRAFDWASTPLGPDRRSGQTPSFPRNGQGTVRAHPRDSVLGTTDWIASTTKLRDPELYRGKGCPQALGGLATARGPTRESTASCPAGDLEDPPPHGGKTVIRENVLIPLLHDGQFRDGYFTYYLIPIFENGKIAGIYDPYMNTTDAVLTKRELAAVAARLGQFLSVTRDSIVAVDRNWCFSYLNEAAVKTYSSDGRELIGKNLWQEFPEAVYEGSPYVEHYKRAMYRGLASPRSGPLPTSAEYMDSTRGLPHPRRNRHLFARYHRPEEGGSGSSAERKAGCCWTFGFTPSHLRNQPAPRKQ